MSRQDRRIARELRAREQAAVIVGELAAAIWPGGQEDLTPHSLRDDAAAPMFLSSPRRGTDRRSHTMTEPTTPAANDTKAFTQPLTSREVAELVGTDPKTLRRFLRDPKSTYAAAGQGGRYTFVKKDIPSLKKRFTTWSNAEAKARAARAAAKAKKAEAKPAVTEAKGAGKAVPAEAPTFTAKDRVDALELALRARGTHISQHPHLV